MKKILAASAALLLLVCSCGPSEAEKKAAMERTAATIDSIIGTTQTPYEACGAVYAEPNVNVNIVLRDSMIKVDLLGEQLMDYFAAAQLKSYDADTFNDITKQLRTQDASLVVNITDTFGGSKTFIFSPEKLRRLRAAKPSSLDVPKVKEQVIAMANGAVPAPAAHAGAQVSASISKGFLTYTVSWPQKSALAGLEQGSLTGRYMDALRRQYSRLGELEYPVVETLKSLGIDGVRIVYTTVDGDGKELKQAFPWREIFK